MTLKTKVCSWDDRVGNVRHGSQHVTTSSISNIGNTRPPSQCEVYHFRQPLDTYEFYVDDSSRRLIHHNWFTILIDSRKMVNQSKEWQEIWTGTVGDSVQHNRCVQSALRWRRANIRRRWCEQERRCSRVYCGWPQHASRYWISKLEFATLFVETASFP